MVNIVYILEVIKSGHFGPFGRIYEDWFIILLLSCMKLGGIRGKKTVLTDFSGKIPFTQILGIKGPKWPKIDFMAITLSKMIEFG